MLIVAAGADGTCVGVGVAGAGEKKQNQHWG